MLTYKYPQTWMNHKMKSLLIKTSGGYTFNLIGVHLYSAVENDRSTQAIDNRPFRGNVVQYETLTKNECTIIVGDFNYNAFDETSLDPEYFNSLGDKALVSLLKTRRTREFNAKYYYNPMWNLMGDYDYLKNQSKPQGTYYWEINRFYKFPWNMLDWVVLSSDIMDTLDIKSLEIVTEINGNNLLQSQPYANSVSLFATGHSDHLPIKLTLNIN